MIPIAVTKTEAKAELQAAIWLSSPLEGLVLFFAFCPSTIKKIPPKKE